MGVGKIYEEEGAMRWTGKFLDTPEAKALYSFIREMGDAMAYSYRSYPRKYAMRMEDDAPPFSYLFQEVEVFEVSGVLMAASFEHGHRGAERGGAGLAQVGGAPPGGVGGRCCGD